MVFLGGVYMALWTSKYRLLGLQQSHHIDPMRRTVFFTSFIDSKPECTDSRTVDENKMLMVYMLAYLQL